MELEEVGRVAYSGDASRVAFGFSRLGPPRRQTDDETDVATCSLPLYLLMYTHSLRPPYPSFKLAEDPGIRVFYLYGQGKPLRS